MRAQLRGVVVQVKTGGKQKKRMMKFVGLLLLLLCLVLIMQMIPVATSGFFTPSPEKKNLKDEDAVTEGYPGVVIELEKDDNNGNTKASVLLRDADQSGEKINQEDTLTKQKDTVGIGNAKDTVSRTLQAASDKAQQMKQGAKDVATDVSSKAKDKVAERASGMKHGAKEESIIGKGEETVVSRTASDKMKQELVVDSASKGIMRRVFRYTMSPLKVASSSLIGVMHLLGVAVAYGMCVWVTFASNYVMGRGVLPRQQFVMVQSKIYPLFYKAMASSIGMALLGHLFRRFPTSLGVQAFNLIASLVMTLVNMLYLEPRTTKVMFERMKKEKEGGVGKDEPIVVASAAAAAEETTTNTTTGGGGGGAAKKPKSVSNIRLNSTYSSMLNVATIISLTWHLVHIAQHLHHNAC
ncbi:hypothetical protein ACP275_14G333600 [Erythranthe tilingii]